MTDEEQKAELLKEWRKLQRMGPPCFDGPDWGKRALEYGEQCRKVLLLKIKPPLQFPELEQ